MAQITPQTRTERDPAVTRQPNDANDQLARKDQAGSNPTSAETCNQPEEKPEKERRPSD